jgi:hypothetical protein
MPRNSRRNWKKPAERSRLSSRISWTSFFIRSLPKLGRAGSDAVEIRQISAMVEFCRFAQWTNRRSFDLIRGSAVRARCAPQFCPPVGVAKRNRMTGYVRRISDILAHRIRHDENSRIILRVINFFKAEIFRSSHPNSFLSALCFGTHIPFSLDTGRRLVKSSKFVLGRFLILSYKNTARRLDGSSYEYMRFGTQIPNLSGGW